METESACKLPRRSMGPHSAARVYWIVIPQSIHVVYMFLPRIIRKARAD